MDSNLSEALWRPWIEHVAAAVHVDPTMVSVTEIHELTREVADRFTRPMAPVSAHLWGLARALHPERDPAELREAICSALPEGLA